ncbi:MAG: hypothetical protein K0B05_07800 [Bacteroidales bacterium]|nr:hypothetical protein [Bacteroidales bacterium]
MMKRFLLSLISLMVFIGLQGQADRTVVLQELEKNTHGNGEALIKTTLKSASRLFGDPNDLTSVILVIPTGAVVEVLEYDPDYLYVFYGDYEGYIVRQHTDFEEPRVIAPAQAQTQPQPQLQAQPRDDRPVQQTGKEVISRFAYLEGKYGSAMAARLDAGKIWKGMTKDMVQDSWGTPQKINRVISGNIIKEEWIYRNSWLYFENDNLVEWGPVRR